MNPLIFSNFQKIFIIFVINIMNKLPNVDMSEVEEKNRIIAEELKEQAESNIEAVIEESLPEVKPRVTIEDEDIFGGMKMDQEEEKPEKPKKEKKKRVMTEAQLETLRKGREKALAVRRAKAKEKKELKELEGKVKQKKKKDMEEFIGESPVAIKPVVQEVQQPSIDMSQYESMLQKGIKSALEQHDSERKARKEKKVIAKKEEAQTQKVANLIHRSQPKVYGQAGFFDGCF